MIDGVFIICVIVHQVLFCTVPTNVLLKPSEGNFSFPSAVHKLKIVLKNGTVVDLPANWIQIDKPSVFSDFHVLCLCLSIAVFLIVFTYTQFPTLRDYIKNKIDIWCSSTCIVKSEST